MQSPIENTKERRLVVASQKGSHMKMKHPVKPGHVIFPNHGSQEIGKSLQHKIIKDAGLKL